MMTPHSVSATVPPAPGRGLFLSFEGIDGAGKSTHIERLAQALRAQGHRLVLTREPGGTALAEQLRSWVLNEPMDTLTEALLIFAGRRHHLQQVIAPALARGETVLCDRFTDATFAYQGLGRGFDLSVLHTLEQWVQAQADLGLSPSAVVLQPDLTLWFDLPAEIAAQRLTEARVPDRFEAQPLAFFKRVAMGYAQRAAQDPHRFARLDAQGEREQVWHQLVAALRARGWWSA